MTTRLSAFGFGTQRNEVINAVHPVNEITRPSCCGFGTRRGHGFADKAQGHHLITRLGSCGFGTRRDGRFDHRESTVEEIVEQQALDGAGVGKHNIEVVADHRVRHTGTGKSTQPTQEAFGSGEVRHFISGVGKSVQSSGSATARGLVYPPCVVQAITASQPPQAATASGVVRDLELEMFAITAVEMLDDEEWQKAA